MSDLLIHRHGRVLQLTLNRPQARNALNNALLTQIAEALEAAAVDDSVGVCVIRGNARFSPPGLTSMKWRKKDLPATLDDIRPRLWARIDAFTKPLIASVNGYALGAGCELACCAT
ncbi:phenylacetate degradation enoyl-CoA hydratase PaaA [Klebsiella pneumoniae subsp. pneumoniae]|uniref:Phenylacetate degradation enoyl-CoA hydratase PaaA n=1 Tax=Klebsiella pneumoniae subsp. pneumoniae TaxID=72407 RepID=A0A377ZUU7_KLEPN|nr:phenylacetate degradation enoyl-CoA hydratase PaaA [Klebsiella pneumoniae subsp. pneumoniae]